ncbi:hydantoinase/oxoprolinase family protein [Microvirga antarctica]|uniref:hydantoinase/oxoprolinase family protein n=1 Tax=Microvirga antarctica TaxID=2819233 RepID=UPI001B3141E1|nr:hydantoinase/oxoprolinase family protein [Microvirga antarctica]
MNDAGEGSSQAVRIGIDAGGTFTDFVAAFPDGRVLYHKEPSSSIDPSEPVDRGIRLLLDQAELSPDHPVLIVHGTTIGLNAVLQRKGAKVAVVVSRGTRDILEFERGRLPDYLNLLARKPEPLVPRERVIEIDARLDAQGETVRSPSREEMDELCDSIARIDPDAVAVSLINSYRNSFLEEEIGAAIRKRFPNILVTESSRVWPEIREYERSVVACLNAGIHPLLNDYLNTLSTRVASTGRPVALQLTTSAGGMLSLESARERPVETMLSGPASGTIAAARLAAEVGVSEAITFDMGGTSADIAILSDGRFEFTTNSHIGGLPLIMPVVGVSSIGAGGGSILTVDSAGALKVGPESAGSDPGPVAYGRGGNKPTLTDCYIALGIIDPADFLGGRLKIDRAAAEAALAVVAGKIGRTDAAEAGQAALDIATTRMATELFKLLALGGHDPSKQMLIPFGGAGPTHAIMLAEEAGLAGIVVPPAAATFCALGAALADVRRDLLRSIGEARFETLDRRLWPVWSELEAEAQNWLRVENVPVLDVSMEYSLDMRYAGQSHNMLVTVAEPIRQAHDLQGVAEALHAAHEALYGFRETDDAVEVVSVRLSITGRVPAITLPDLAVSQAAPVPKGTRAVFQRDRWVDAQVFHRSDLLADDVVAGPAVIVQPDTTTWLPSPWTLKVHRNGALIASRSNADEA